MRGPEEEVAASLGVPPLEVTRPEDPASIWTSFVHLSLPRPAATLTQGRSAINRSRLSGTLVSRVIPALVQQPLDNRSGLLGTWLHFLLSWSTNYFTVTSYFIIV